MVLLGGGCCVGGILGSGVWVLGGCSCSLVSSCCAGFLSLRWLFMTSLLVLDEDFTHELRGAGDLLAWHQLHSADKQKEGG